LYVRAAKDTFYAHSRRNDLKKGDTQSKMTKNLFCYKNGLAFVAPGVDVMITIFCDFRQFSAKKMAFFSKSSVMINVFQNLAFFETKTPIFSLNFFGKNIF
jgi:hypothetical protein